MTEIQYTLTVYENDYFDRMTLYERVVTSDHLPNEGDWVVIEDAEEERSFTIPVRSRWFSSRNGDVTICLCPQIIDPSTDALGDEQIQPGDGIWWTEFDGDLDALLLECGWTSNDPPAKVVLEVDGD